jgi:hypothetical protein
LGSLLFASSFPYARAAADGPWSTLGTPDQIEKETLALRLLASAPVQAELRNLEAMYAQDPIAQMPQGSATLKSAAASMAMNACLGAVNKDPDRPVLLWGSNAAHAWHGLQVPRSGIVQDNPDNAYRSTPIDGSARYEIRGKIKAPAPAQETFVLYSALPGSTEGQVKEHLTEEGSVALNDIPVAPDGTFVVTVDASPAAGRPGHLQTSPDARNASILIRDTMSDWATQNPVALTIERLSGPPVRPAPDEAALAADAAKLLRMTGKYWLDWEHRVFFSRPVNTFSLRFARGTGWGFTQAGHYALEKDEALVITVERRDAAYFALQLSDLWGPTVNYTERNGSLNQSQARPNADASYSFVVCVDDPGVHNWLDSGGLPAGMFQVRWQNLPANTTDEGAIRTLKVIKLRDLKGELPPGAAWVTPKERTAQLAERRASYLRRLTV